MKHIAHAAYRIRVQMSATGLLVIIFLALFLSGCTEGNNAAGNKKDGEETVEIAEPVKSFLINTLPDNYSFYTLKPLLPVTMDDLRANGIRIGSRVPDGLLPPNVISILYSGSLLPGTEVQLSETTTGMEKFDGIKLIVLIHITPDGSIKKMPKTIILFSDDDAKRVTSGDLVKVLLQ